MSDYEKKLLADIKTLDGMWCPFCYSMNVKKDEGRNCLECACHTCGRTWHEATSKQIEEIQASE